MLYNYFLNTKKLMIFAFILTSQMVFSAEISGQIKLSKDLQKNPPKQGSLYIFAKRYTKDKMAPQPPVAVLKIDTPTFPQKFSISEKNVMIPGTEFKGPLTISARFSPSGDALDKSGPQGTDTKNEKAEVGFEKISIELK